MCVCVSCDYICGVVVLLSPHAALYNPEDHLSPLAAPLRLPPAFHFCSWVVRKGKKKDWDGEAKVKKPKIVVEWKNGVGLLRRVSGFF